MLVLVLITGVLREGAHGDEMVIKTVTVPRSTRTRVCPIKAQARQRVPTCCFEPYACTAIDGARMRPAAPPPQVGRDPGQTHRKFRSPVTSSRALATGSMPLRWATSMSGTTRPCPNSMKIARSTDGSARVTHPNPMLAAHVIQCAFDAGRAVAMSRHASLVASARRARRSLLGQATCLGARRWERHRRGRRVAIHGRGRIRACYVAQ